jgi:hypothetical protein
MEEALPHYGSTGAVTTVLTGFCAAAGVTGPVGVDAFVHWTGSGSLALRPVVEINPRHTMGRVALELSKRVSPGHAVRFSIMSLTKAPAAWPPLETDENGLMKGGMICLNDPARARRVLAVLEVSPPGKTAPPEAARPG